MDSDLKKEEWLSLCELAATEQDPDKLLALVKEISRLLEQKENSLRQRRHIPVRESMDLQRQG